MSLSEATSARVNIPGPGGHPAPSGRSPLRGLAAGGLRELGPARCGGGFTPPSWDPAARYRRPCTSCLLGSGPARPDTEHPPPGRISRAVTGSPRPSDGAEGGERRERAWRGAGERRSQAGTVLSRGPLRGPGTRRSNCRKRNDLRGRS